VAREDHADRLDLIDRGIGRVKETGEFIEAHLALNDSPEVVFEIGETGGLAHDVLRDAS
jgi:hypothetical protein